MYSRACGDRGAYDMLHSGCVWALTEPATITTITHAGNLTLPRKCGCCSVRMRAEVTAWPVHVVSVHFWVSLGTYEGTRQLGNCWVPPALHDVGARNCWKASGRVWTHLVSGTGCAKLSTAAPGLCCYRVYGLVHRLFVAGVHRVHLSGPCASFVPGSV